MSDTSHIKLSELSERIRNVLRSGFDNQYFWVVAEVSGHKYNAEKKWHFLDFVEKIEGSNTEAAKLKCNVWVEGAKRIEDFEKMTGQKFADGMQVLVKVKVEYHIVHGLSLVMLDIDHSYTLGNLEKQRLETLMRLIKENPDKVVLEGDEYITGNKQLKMNRVIQQIALVASGNSEGYHDFVSNITRNKFGYKFIIDHYPSTVQGKEAERELVETMVKIFKSGKAYDCVVMIRGGGAKTDFLVFDTYGVARAVARFPIPVITGIGHHRDISITDMMAHTHTNAPTKAAEFIVSYNHAFEERVIELRQQIIIRSQQMIASCKEHLHARQNTVLNKTRTLISRRKDALVNTNQLVLNKTKNLLLAHQRNLVTYSARLSTLPLIKVRNKQNDLLNMTANLKGFTANYFIHQRGYLQHHLSVFKMMSPKNILKKGFAIVKQKGKILKDAEQIEIGNELMITMQETEITTTVTAKQPTNGKENEL